MQHPEFFERPQAGETMVAYDLTGDGKERQPEQVKEGTSNG
jgi:hypothetical protein